MAKSKGLLKLRSNALILIVLLLATPCHAVTDINQLVQKLTNSLFTVTGGDVLKSTKTYVYLSVGQQSGVMVGNKFEIIRQGELLVEGDPSFGYEETTIAKVEVEKVREKVAICKIQKQTVIPEKGDKAYIHRKKIDVLVVGQFVYNNGFNVLTKTLQEKITTVLTARGIQVVERDQLERLLQEQKLGYSGLIDINTAQKVGELLGANGLIIGSLNNMGNFVTINTRLVDIKTGKALSASEADLARTPTIINLLETPINYGMAGTSSRNKVKKKNSRVQRGKKFYFEDFSEVEEGLIPKGWSGGEKLLVKKDGRHKVLTNFKKGEQKVTSSPIKFPTNFKFEWEINTYDNFWLKMGNIEIQFNPRYHRGTSEIRVNEARNTIKGGKRNQTVRFKLEKQGAVLRVFCDEEEVLLTREPDFQIPGSFTFVLRPDFKLLKIVGTEI